MVPTTRNLTAPPTPLIIRVQTYDAVLHYDSNYTPHKYMGAITYPCHTFRKIMSVKEGVGV